MSQARLAAILDIADDAIISINDRQEITLFDQGAERIFGYAAQEALGHPLDMLLPARFASAHRRHLADFATSADAARRRGQRQDIYGRRKDGSEFPAEASISKLEFGDEMEFILILRDISMRKQVEQTFALRADRLPEHVRQGKHLHTRYPGGMSGRR
jgi:PAS domain S-box-containing protein